MKFIFKIGDSVRLKPGVSDPDFVPLQTELEFSFV